MALAEKIRSGLEKHVAKEKEKAAKKKETKSKIHHFEVHPANGGHLVEVHEQDEMGYPRHTKEKDSIHKTMGKAAKHMSGMCTCGSCGESTQETGVVAGKGGKSESQMDKEEGNYED